MGYKVYARRSGAGNDGYVALDTIPIGESATVTASCSAREDLYLAGEEQGVEGLDEIKVKADIIAGNKKGKSLAEFIEEYIDLSLERHGDRAVLISRIKPSHFSFSFWGDGNSRIDLTVEVPDKMNIEIKDGSGDTELKNMDHLRIS